MAAHIPPNFRRVITAAAAGNVIEWYDFYIFGSLAAVLSVKFFEKGHPSAALITTIGIFTAGFLIRPLGAFLFGWLGDRVGRKYTFLITLSGMAIGTGAIGLVPTFEHDRVGAAVILLSLRMIQGLCLGGQYGGAITYVAEHVSDERRGYYTGWLQTSPTLGIVLSLVVIIAMRTYFGNAAFNDWAWRIPFLFSFLLMFIAYYIRTPLSGVADLRGDQGQGPDDQESMEGGFPQRQYQVRLDRKHRGARRRAWSGTAASSGRCTSCRQVSKVDVLNSSLYRGSRADHWDPDTDLLRLAVRPYRPQAGDIGRAFCLRQSLTIRSTRGSERSRSRAISTTRLRSSSSPFSSPMSGWSTDRSARFSLNISPAGSATRRCPCPITSATAGAADWCRSSPRRPIRRRAVSAMP